MRCWIRGSAMASSAPLLVAQPAPGWAAGAVGRRTLMGRAMQTRGAGFGLLVLVVVGLGAVLANVIAPYNPSQIQSAGVLAAPSPQYLLGTDAIGRDVLSRIIYGTRVSILAGAVSVGVALTAGILIGLLAGYYGGLVVDALLATTDALRSLPPLFLAPGPPTVHPAPPAA